MAIPFVYDVTMPVGTLVPVLPQLARVLAPNPGPFTYTGTQTYLLGDERLTLIDPGPDLDDHLMALVEAIDGRPAMGWSTTVIAPPDGHMAAYLYHLERLCERDIERLVPTHGPLIPEAPAFMRAVIDHRLAREQQILEALKKGYRYIAPMVEELYRDLDPILHPAAARSVLAHIIKLVAEGRVVCEDTPSLTASYRLAA